MKCSICGFEVGENKDKYYNEIPIYFEINEGSPHYERVMETFGKGKFAVCFICWLKALGIKPKEGKQEDLK